MKKLLNLSLLVIMALPLMEACSSKVAPEAKTEGEITIDEKRGRISTARGVYDSLRNAIRAMESELLELEGNKPKGKLVTIMDVASMPFAHFVEIQGVAKSEKNITLTTDIGGLVTAVHVNEGQRVSKGQTLVQLDNSVVLRNIDELKTSLDLAVIIYEKQKRLWDQNIGSEIQYLEAKANKQSLERRLQTTYAQLAKSKIKSPINGSVDEVFAKVGEMVSPGRPAVRVINLSRIEISADMPESYVGTVRKGDEVVVFFPAIEEERKATISSVGQVINPNNRTFKVETILTNRDGHLKANMLANIKIRDYMREKAFAVPTRIVQHGKDHSFVYAVDSSESGQFFVRKALVTEGRTYEGQTEILEGLQDGEVLVLEGYRDVIPGDLLRIDNP